MNWYLEQIFIQKESFLFHWVLWLSVRVDMDEYDELFEIEDDFDDQFADELEALADLEKGEEQRTVAN